jgi:hypothetical protein
MLEAMATVDDAIWEANKRERARTNGKNILVFAFANEMNWLN